MVRFLISIAFGGGALSRGMYFLEPGAYFDLSVNDAALIKGKPLFEARHLLEKIH